MTESGGSTCERLMTGGIRAGASYVGGSAKHAVTNNKLTMVNPPARITIPAGWLGSEPGKRQAKTWSPEGKHLLRINADQRSSANATAASGRWQTRDWWRNGRRPQERDYDHTAPLRPTAERVARSRAPHQRRPDVTQRPGHPK